MATWKTRAVDLLHKVDRVSQDRPIYLFDATEAVDIVRLNHAGGGTAWSLSERFRERLESEGRWEGLGFATVIDTSMRSDEDILATVLHEYAHWVDLAYAKGTAGTKAASLLLRHGSPESVPGTHPVRSGVDGLRRPWCHHGPTFLRLLCHLVWRAQGVGWQGALHHTFNAPSYLLSDIGHYQDALGNELDQLAAVPLVYILDVDPPTAYCELVGQDFRSAEDRYQLLQHLNLQRSEPMSEAERQAEARKDREHAQRLVESLPEIEEALDNVLAQINQADDELTAALKAARDHHRRVVEPLVIRRDYFEQEQRAAKIAERQLVETCDDERLLERKKALDEQRRAIVTSKW